MSPDKLNRILIDAIKSTQEDLPGNLTIINTTMALQVTYLITLMPMDAVVRYRLTVEVNPKPR